MLNVENEPHITSSQATPQSVVGMYALLGFVLFVVLGLSFVAIKFGGAEKDTPPKTEYTIPSSTYKDSTQPSNKGLTPETDGTAVEKPPVETYSTPALEKKPATPVGLSPIVTSMSAVPCTDTDGGKFPNTYGETTGASRTVVTDTDGTRRYVDGKVQTVKDVCVSAGGTTVYQGQTVLVQVNEVFCGDDGRITGNGVACPLGCRNGACIVEPTQPTVWLRADGQNKVVRKEYGSTVVLTWDSTLAETCSIRSYGAATELWNESSIPLSGTKKLLVQDTVTSTNIYISCTSSTGYTTEDSVRVYSQREV